MLLWGNPRVDVENFLLTEFLLINAQGITKLENHHLVAPNEIMTLGKVIHGC